MLLLRVLRGKQKDQSFTIQGSYVILGRDATSDIVVQDEAVSRKHARIVRRDALYVLQDLQSSNGTFVNGERVAESALHPDDVVKLGSTEFGVSIDEDAPAQKSQHSTTKFNLRIREDQGDETSTVFRAVVDVGRSTFRDLDLSRFDAAEVQRKLNTIYGVSELVSSGLPLPRLLAGILEIVFESVPADRGCVLLFSSATNELEPLAAKNRDRLDDVMEISISQTIIQHALTKGVAILSTDMATDSRFESSKSAIFHRMQAAICVPLMRGERHLGILHVDTKHQGAVLGNDDLRLLTAIGNEAALAVDNARLTEEKIRAERLAAVGQAMADFSHYVKNLLQGIMGYTPLIDRALESNDELMLRKGWSRVKEYNGKIADLIQNTLFASGERIPEVRPTSVQSLVEKCLDVVSEKGKAAKVEIRTRFAPEVSEVEVDPEWIGRALLKIVENGVEAMEATGGVLTVSTVFDDSTGFLEICVADTGLGIPKKDQSRVFEYFFSTKGMRGTGLGLAIAKKLIEGNGGRISIESEPGAGTTFRIQLPAAHRVRSGSPTDLAVGKDLLAACPPHTPVDKR